MSDIPESRAGFSAQAFRCLVCGLKSPKAIKATPDAPCPENRSGHVWVHQRWLDDHRKGRAVGRDALRQFQTYPRETEKRLGEDAAAEKDAATEQPSSSS